MSSKTVEPLDACTKAAEYLRHGGFIFLRASMKSTSCYYGRKGYHGSIRVSTHSRKKDRAGAHSIGPVVTYVTFPWNGGPVTELRVMNYVANAIGMFLLKAKRL